jgi:hypothetical protein
MVVQRKGALARRHGGDVVAQLACAEQRRDLADAGIETFSGVTARSEGGGARLQLDIGDIDEGFVHGCSLAAMMSGLYPNRCPAMT